MIEHDNALSQIEEFSSRRPSARETIESVPWSKNHTLREIRACFIVGFPVVYQSNFDLFQKHEITRGPILDVKKDDLLRIVNSAPIGPDTKMTPGTLDILVDSLSRQINTMSSTSAGRFLDAVAMVLGVSLENSYDGECPMKLEALSKTTELQIEPRFMKTKAGLTLDTSHGLMQVLELKEKSVSKQEIAYAAQWYLGESLAYIACRVANENQVQHVGFSGGVALNRIITEAVIDYVNHEKLVPLIHNNVPPGDGGISIGQVVVAAAKLSDS